MRANVHISMKRLGVNKNNQSIVIMVSLAAFVAAFCFSVSRALISQRNYQNTVIAGKTTAVNQLKANIEAKQALVNSYNAFVSQPNNVIGGISGGEGERDGDNAKIVLDALPSSYDFPALVSSLEKITKGNGYNVTSIEGKDDEVNQQNTVSSSNPTPIEIPFQVGVSGNYKSMKTISDIFYNSIRPFQIQTIELKGTGSGVSATIAAKTYYLPEKNLLITTKDVQ